MAAELWEAVRAEGGVVWGEEAYSEDEPLGDGPNYRINETDPEDVKNWKKTRQEEIAKEKRAAAALAEEEAAALAETRRVEEKRQAAVETAGQTEQKTMKKRDWMADMREVMRVRRSGRRKRRRGLRGGSSRKWKITKGGCGRKRMDLIWRQTGTV